MYEIITEKNLIKFDSLPILNHNTVNKYTFNIIDEDLYKIHNIIYENPGLELKDYIQLIDFCVFTEESLEYFFLLCNQYKNSFYKVCGPFACHQGKWYIVNYNFTKCDKR